MEELIAIDPGNTTGWATFSPVTGLLHYAGTTSVEAWLAEDDRPYSTLIIEIPQVYRAGQSVGDPNDLIKVAVNAGQWIERFSRRGATVRKVLPKDWKGQVSKEIHNRRVLALLTADEKTRILPSHDHNMVDAIGLGLFHLKRLRR